MMLGAQARAAEYNAAKNASARQASREAEEQKLPPKPTPISLSAYTRNTQVSRNKGTKNWVPLVLSEADEDENVQEAASQASAESNDLSVTSAPEQTTPSAPRSQDVNRIRVNMPTPLIPVAPRAMRMPGQPLMPVPQVATVAYPQPMMTDGHGYMPTALYAGDLGTQPVGMLPYHPQYGWVAGLPMLDRNSHVAESTPEGMRRYGGMMVPTEITPTKQEQKLSMLSQAYRNPLHATPDPRLHMYEHAASVNPMHSHQQHCDLPMLIQNPAGDFSLPPPHIGMPGIFHRPDPQHRYSDFEPGPRTAIFDPRSSIVRRSSDPETSAPPVTPRLPATLLHTMDPASLIKDKENDEPYDRATKMQKFIAAQQAVAKTGKTVLNNPELRKNQEYRAEQKVKVNETPFNDGQTSSDDSCMDEESNRIRTAPKVPPGLEYVQGGKIDFEKLLATPTADSTSQQFQDDRLRAFFDVGADDWFDLKPVTTKNRKKMLDVMSHVALGAEEKKYDSRISTNAPGQVETWLHKDSRGFQAARSKADEIATDYSTRLREREAGNARGTTVSREDDIHAGLVRGAGNVMATLTEYVTDSQTKSGEPPGDYFNKTRQAPQFAIERNVLGANLSSLSLFEGENNSVSNPPNRISRDPRFRFTTKEGTRARSEDEWPGRHDIYGGRMS